MEYIESTGTQWIDTNIYPNSNTYVYTDFQFISLNSQQRLFGNDSDSSNNEVSYGFYINGVLRWGYAYKDGVGNWINTGISVDNNRHILEFNNDRKVKVDNNTYNSSISGSVTNNSNYSLALMARNNMGTIDCYSSVRMYLFKIYQANTLVRNLIPCYRNSDNEIGLYDTVNGVFYTNQGTGAFLKGNDVGSVTSSTIVTNPNDHTLYAIWEEN